MRIRIIFVILLVSSIVCKANLVINPGFETMEVIGEDIPITYGDWDGDDSLIVGPTSGITPYEGQNMLQFEHTFAWGWFPEGNTSQVYQLIDINGYEDVIASGNAVAQASVYYNRIAGDSQTDTKFGFNIFAFDGEPSTFRDRCWYPGAYEAALAYSGLKDFYSDGDPLTWECGAIDLLIPAETTFLAICIKAQENIYNDYEMPEFDGHFADAVSVEIVSEPAIPVSVDIKPSDCPNPLNVESRGVLPVAILGSDDFDVNSIDLTSIRLAGVAPVRSSFEDVATPVSDLNDCACTTEGPDGFTDLVLKFKTPEIVAAVDSCGTISKGDVISLTLTGTLSSDQSITGSDCVVIVGNVPRKLTAMRSDVNRDGIINVLDFAWIAEYWLEPAFVE